MSPGVQPAMGNVVLAAALPQEQAATEEAGQEAEEAGHEAEQDEAILQDMLGEFQEEEEVEEDNAYDTAGIVKALTVRRVRRQESMKSIMAGVRERMGMLHGT
mmetsp:Transcript_51044/g.91927  ORF Transcript_51044/g.91927 Transcript_51044/m.91927 type:complete len:103 (-) Transcript_51044:3099-3407(-)